MKIRKIFFWLHLICGLAAGIVVTIMSLTGVLLTYEKQMTAQADQSLYPIETSQNETSLSPETLVKRFQKSRPEAVLLNITLPSDPKALVSITTAPNKINYINPYTGEILGPGSPGIRRFFRTITDLHRWLALSGEDRQTGRALTGAFNLAFLFIVISGFYLWWPRKWTRQFLGSILWFRREKTAKARDFNWHHVFGFWLTIPLVLVIASGVVISYPWASNLVFRLAGSPPPNQLGPPGRRKAPPKIPAAKINMPQTEPAAIVPLELSGLDPLVASIRDHSESWDTISFRPPTLEDKTISFSIDAGSGIQPQFRSTIVMDRKSGNIISADSFRDLDPGLRLRIWFRFVHTGEYYGFAGQTVAGIASAVSIILVWTGFALSIRRFNTWIRRQRR